jgi:hypothetical protein
MILGFGVRVRGFEFRVLPLRFRGMGYEVWGLEFRVRV